MHRLDYLGIVTNCYQLLLKFTLVSPNATRNYFWYPLTGVLFYLFVTMTSLDHIVTIPAGNILDALSRAAKITYLRTHLSLPVDTTIPTHETAAGIRLLIRSQESVDILNPLATMTEADGAWSVESNGQRYDALRTRVFDHVSPLAIVAHAAAQVAATAAAQAAQAEEPVVQDPGTVAEPPNAATGQRPPTPPPLPPPLPLTNVMSTTSEVEQYMDNHLDWIPMLKTALKNLLRSKNILSKNQLVAATGGNSITWVNTVQQTFSVPPPLVIILISWVEKAANPVVQNTRMTSDLRDELISIGIASKMEALAIKNNYAVLDKNGLKSYIAAKYITDKEVFGLFVNRNGGHDRTAFLAFYALLELSTPTVFDPSFEEMLMKLSPPQRSRIQDIEDIHNIEQWMAMMSDHHWQCQISSSGQGRIETGQLKALTQLLHTLNVGKNYSHSSNSKSNSSQSKSSRVVQTRCYPNSRELPQRMSAREIQKLSNVLKNDATLDRQSRNLSNSSIAPSPRLSAPLVTAITALDVGQMCKLANHMENHMLFLFNRISTEGEFDVIPSTFGSNGVVPAGGALATSSNLMLTTQQIKSWADNLLPFNYNEEWNRETITSQRHSAYGLKSVQAMAATMSNVSNTLDTYYCKVMPGLGSWLNNILLEICNLLEVMSMSTSSADALYLTKKLIFHKISKSLANDVSGSGLCPVKDNCPPMIARIPMSTIFDATLKSAMFLGKQKLQQKKHHQHTAEMIKSQQSNNQQLRVEMAIATKGFQNQLKQLNDHKRNISQVEKKVDNNKNGKKHPRYNKDSKEFAMKMKIKREFSDATGDSFGGKFRMNNTCTKCIICALASDRLGSDIKCKSEHSERQISISKEKLLKLIPDVQTAINKYKDGSYKI